MTLRLRKLAPDQSVRMELAKQIRQAASEGNIGVLKVLCNGRRKGLLTQVETIIMVRCSLPCPEEKKEEVLKEIFGCTCRSRYLR